MEFKDKIDDYKGEWILFFHDEIIDHSANVEDILKTVDERFPGKQFPSDDVKITKVFEGSPRQNLIDK